MTQSIIDKLLHRKEDVSGQEAARIAYDFAAKYDKAGRLYQTSMDQMKKVATDLAEEGVTDKPLKGYCNKLGIMKKRRENALIKKADYQMMGIEINSSVGSTPEERESVGKLRIYIEKDGQVTKTGDLDVDMERWNGGIEQNMTSQEMARNNDTLTDEGKVYYETILEGVKKKKSEVNAELEKVNKQISETAG